MKKSVMFLRKQNILLYAITGSVIFSVVNMISPRIYSQEIPGNINILLKTLPKLSHDREDRELLYQYSIGDLNSLSDTEAKRIISELAERGVGVISFWEKGEAMKACIDEGIRIARIQEDLGLSVAVDATRLLYGFYDGTPATAHINDEGKPFTDTSFAGQWMGCPFTLSERVPVIKSRITAYTEAYRTAGVNIDIVTADWEIDGPHEWNEAWANSKKCVKCREHLPNIQDFKSFQSTIRSLRSKLLRESYTNPIIQLFPDALIANYATSPNDGWRYWYDYFEYPQSELPHIKDQQALYRPWYDEFTETGLTMAMPVVYTWYPIFNWYPDYSSDYRWFYNMLKVGSNAGKSTPQSIPIATFVHWHTTAPPDHPASDVEQMSTLIYKELLWHLLLRGNDIFYSWCMKDEIEAEMILLQEVYNNSLIYNRWIQSGRPVFFEIPAKESNVISGLVLDNKVLVRRTDFTDHKDPITCILDGVNLVIPYKPGECQIITIDN